MATIIVRAAATTADCDWEIRRPYAGAFRFVRCEGPAHQEIDGHPRCKEHAEKTLRFYRERGDQLEVA